jgi:hypothetical protein
MAVPGHDTRDHEFALKYDIPIRCVVAPDDKSLSDSGKAFSGRGTIINSSNSTLGLDINGLCSKEAASKVIEWVEKTGNGKKKVPWGFSLSLSLSLCYTYDIIALAQTCLSLGELQVEGLAFCSSTLLGGAYPSNFFGWNW